jgi:tRNA threonylcarbamoyl adenosine modification protein YjeE
MQTGTITHTLANEAATEALARELAAHLKGRETILLDGPLGAGKTAFARALIRAGCGAPDMAVPSPSYTLIQPYETPSGRTLWHCDLYRLSGPEELDELGLPDILGRDIVMIEWPGRMGVYRPAQAIEIRLEPADNDPHRRHITITRAPEGFVPA